MAVGVTLELKVALSVDYCWCKTIGCFTGRRMRTWISLWDWEGYFHVLSTHSWGWSSRLAASQSRMRIPGWYTWIPTWRIKGWLDIAYIQYYPRLRHKWKPGLNSFYRKLGQRSDLSKAKFVTDLVYLLLTQPNQVIHHFHIMTRDTPQIEFKNGREFDGMVPMGNMTLIIFLPPYPRQSCRR